MNLFDPPEVVGLGGTTLPHHAEWLILFVSVGSFFVLADNVDDPHSQQTRDNEQLLGQRCRRWANIEPEFVQCVVFAGISVWMIHIRDVEQMLGKC